MPAQRRLVVRKIDLLAIRAYLKPAERTRSDVYANDELQPESASDLSLPSAVVSMAGALIVL
jgi:hypothetical protein